MLGIASRASGETALGEGIPVRIEAVATSPFDRIAYRVATAHGPADALLPFFLATTTQLPEGVDAVIAASDLQGRDDEGRLLGHGACKHLLTLCGTGHLPDPRRVGVVLAGDLWARPALERALLSENWGFLVAMTPERDRRIMGEPFAQSDVALSVVDYLGIDHEDLDFFGRSAFREYGSGRFFFTAT